MPSTAMDPERTLEQKAKGFLRRNARQLDAIIEAAGVEWLLEQHEKNRASGRKAEQRTVDALKRELFPSPRPVRVIPPATSEYLPF